jgi:gamma-D-glutamyl-L-lysine dipeptidyl-peptidase
VCRLRDVHLHRLLDPWRDAVSILPGSPRYGRRRAEDALMVDTSNGHPPLDDPPLFRTRIAAPLAPMHSEPLVASQQVSQQLAGHDIDAMDVDGDWVRARGEDGYEGWIHSGFLDPRGVKAERPETRRMSLGCRTERGGDERRALPLRAFLRGDERVIEGEAIDLAAAKARFPLSPDAIATSARELFRGTSYVWGGVTPWGADCSGLVQAAFALHGRMLPRDAWQQAELGQSIAGDFAALRPADLLFFTDRPDKRVTHVGIALGAGRMVHLALGRGGYATESLESDDPYVVKLRQRFLFSRRIIQS